MEVAVGIDIGGTNTEFGLVERDGRCLDTASVSTTSFETPEVFIQAVAEGIWQCQNELEMSTKVVGIGIGAPNGNYYNGTIEYAPNLKWEGVIHLRDLLRKHFSVPVLVTNDANAAAIGEMTYGAAKGQRDVLVVTLGTGVGSGFVSHGQVIYGHDGFAGELGHTIIEENGRTCSCGRRGCLETYASATGFVRTARDMLAASDGESQLGEIALDQLSAEHVAQAARKGDPLARAIFGFTAKKLAFGLANAVAITSPRMIVLFGGLARSGELILEPTRKYLDEYLLTIFKGKVDLVTTEMAGENSAILGAAAMVWQEASDRGD
jgi:glucokinase